jgi:hypothetical protein
VLLSELAWVSSLVCRSELRSGAAWEHWSAPTLVQMTASHSELSSETLLAPKWELQMVLPMAMQSVQLLGQELAQQWATRMATLMETSSEHLSVVHSAKQWVASKAHPSSWGSWWVVWWAQL